MEFQTRIQINKQQHDQIDYNSKLLLLGSCFAESIGEKLNYCKFQSLVNPFGILFHPLAIEKLILNALNDYQYTKADLENHQGIYNCFDAHSKLSSTSESQILSDLNENIQITKKWILNSSHLVITLGTAWTYRHIESDVVVANCHKMPQKQFIKELVSVDDLTQSLSAILSLVRSVNPDCRFIFTVSPIRHLKDGFVENNRSKAHLISAVHQIVDRRKHNYYFPSYEMQLDELRDYRFYSEDMIHPNSVAIEYIWQRFFESWMSDESLQIMDVIEAIQKDLGHKAFHPESEQHQAFLSNLEAKKAKLSAQFPHIVF
ncbi:MAG: GSCFA domain-containing protein [Flavobacteriaceae bacterium]|nr:GSCFA domain-containing protein [Flavobacteriaceae bacterium]